MPLALRTAPPVAEELSQPRPAEAGGLPQGQAMTLFTPGSHRLVKPEAKRSRRKTSKEPLVSPGTRSPAMLSKAT